MNFLVAALQHATDTAHSAVQTVTDTAHAVAADTTHAVTTATQHVADTAHAAAGAAHAESPNVFALTGNVVFWTVIIFVVLFILLSKFAFPAILGYAAAREKRIQDALDAAKHDREETQRLLEEQRAALITARTESQQLIAEAQKAAERVRRETLDKARADQEEIIARAKVEIEAERVRAIESLRKEAVDLAVAAASRLISKKLDSLDDRRIVTEFLASVDSGKVAASK